MANLRGKPCTSDPARPFRGAACTDPAHPLRMGACAQGPCEPCADCYEVTLALDLRRLNTECVLGGDNIKRVYPDLTGTYLVPAVSGSDGACLYRACRIGIIQFTAYNGGYYPDGTPPCERELYSWIQPIELQLSFDREPGGWAPRVLIRNSIDPFGGYAQCGLNGTWPPPQVKPSCTSTWTETLYAYRDEVVGSVGIGPAPECPEASPCGMGVCCHRDGTCTVGTEAECQAASGAYMGDGTRCADIDCHKVWPPLTGACCLPDGTCVDTSEPNCQTLGGVYRGDGTSCAAVDCNADPGDCCHGQPITVRISGAGTRDCCIPSPENPAHWWHFTMPSIDGDWELNSGYEPPCYRGTLLYATREIHTNNNCTHSINLVNTAVYMALAIETYPGTDGKEGRWRVQIWCSSYGRMYLNIQTAWKHWLSNEPCKPTGSAPGTQLEDFCQPQLNGSPVCTITVAP